MFRIVNNQLRNLDKQEYTALKELCKLSKNLYNSTLYAVRQYYFTEKKYLRYESAYHVCKENENYQLLNTDIAQQTMKVVDRNFKSFFALVSKAKDGDYKFIDVKLPHYLPKDGYLLLIFLVLKLKTECLQFLCLMPLKRNSAKLNFHSQQFLKVSKLRKFVSILLSRSRN